MTAVAGALLATLAIRGGAPVAVSDGGDVSHYEVVEQWTVPRGPAGVPVSIALSSDSVYVGDARSRSVLEFDLTSGVLVARWEPPSGWGSSHLCGVVLGEVMAADNGVFALWGCDLRNASFIARLDPGGVATRVVDVSIGQWSFRHSVIALGRLYSTEGAYLTRHSLVTGDGIGSSDFGRTDGAAGAFDVLPSGLVARITPDGTLAVVDPGGTVIQERSLAPFEPLAVDVDADGTIYVLGRVDTTAEVRRFDGALADLGSGPIPDLEIGPDVAAMAPLGFAVVEGRIAAVVGSRRLAVYEWTTGAPDHAQVRSIAGGWPPGTSCAPRNSAWCVSGRPSMSLAPVESGSAAGWVVLDQLEGTVHKLDDAGNTTWSLPAPNGALDVAGGDGIVWATDADGGLWRLDAPGDGWVQVEGYKGEHGSSGGRVTVADPDPLVTWPTKGQVVSVTAATGQVSITAESGVGALWPSDLAVSGIDGAVLLAGGADGAVERRTDRGDVETRWQVGGGGVAHRIGAAVSAGGTERAAVLVPEFGIQVYDARNGVLIGEAMSPEAASAEDVALRPDGQLLVAEVGTASITLLDPNDSAPTPTPDPTAAAPPVCVLSGDKRASPSTVVLGDGANIDFYMSAACPPAARVDGIDLALVVYTGAGMTAMNRRLVPTIVAGLEALIQGVDGRYDRVALVSYSFGAEVSAPLSGDIRRVAAALHRLPWSFASGDLRSALEGAEEAFDGAPPRASHKVVVLVSDGQNSTPHGATSPPDWRPAAQRLKDAGVEIFVVAMSDQTLLTLDLREIASDEGHFMTAFDSSSFARALEVVKREAYADRPGDVSLIDDLAEDIAYVDGSANPAAHVAPGRLSWHWPVLPTWGLTVTYAVRPERAGRLETNASAVAYYTDVDGGHKSFVFPRPVIDVITPTPSPTPVPTATAIPPGQVFLPVVLSRGCVGGSRGVDAVLAIDASTSMLQASGGRTRLEAAVSAAGVFLGLLDLGGLDQAAIVTFNNEADVRQALTGDRSALEQALQGIGTAEKTRIHRGIEEAHRELSSWRHRDANVTVLVLLTDGRSNPEPADVAIASAAAAKAHGILIVTIGLGSDVDADALRAIASKPDHYYPAPAADDLEHIYRDVSERVACPGAGGRATP